MPSILLFLSPHHHNQQHLQGGCRVRLALVGRSKDPCSVTIPLYPSLG